VRGASDHFDVPASAYDQVFDASIIHLGGTGLLKKLDGPASVTLLKEAKKRGRTVAFDLIGASAETLSIVEPLLSYIDYFMPSIEEAKDMSGKSSAEDCARCYLDRGAVCCVFTLGSDGAYYAHKDGTRLPSPAYDVKVVDTTGCGDAFDAGFITALHHKMDLETSLRFAQAAAGLVATGLGSDAGIQSFEHTLKVMKDWKIKREANPPPASPRHRPCAAGHRESAR
jgi:sugar/nucleoside kinase (ribokinase family)